MSPKSFVQFHQERTEILWVQVRCLDTDRDTDRDTHRPGPRGGPSIGGPPKKDQSYQKGTPKGDNRYKL